MQSNIVWSHSRLNTLMNNPLEYFLIYNLKIKPKIQKPAFLIGSGVHELLEKNETDATEYFIKNGPVTMHDGNSIEQCLVENIAKLYFKEKDNIYNELLRDLETGEILDILLEEHELKITANIKSKKFEFNHNFLGIIDLLILTEKGWILVDYKTSSRSVDWNSYKSQLFKYLLLLKSEFPDIPIYKIAIINLKKTQIKLRKNENELSFKKRIEAEYADNELIDYHIYNYNEFDDEKYNQFVDSLIGLLDTAEMIVENNLYFLNYSNIVGEYGESEYASIFYGIDGAELLYNIGDYIYDKNTNKIVTTRDCRKIDLKAVNNNFVMNNYYKFKSEFNSREHLSKEELFDYLKTKYITDDYLLEVYYDTYNYLKEIDKK